MLRRLGSVGLLFAAFFSSVVAQDLSKPKVILEWRSELIRSLAYTSDGKQLVVSPKDKECWIFDAQSGAKAELELKGRGVTNFLLQGPRPGTIYCFESMVSRLVDLQTGKDITNNGSLVQLSSSGELSPRRDLLAMAAISGGVQLLTADLKRSEATLMPTDPKSAIPADWQCCAAYSPDGRFVAGGRPTGQLCLWAMDGIKQTGLKTVAAHSGKIEALSFHNGELVSIGLDGKIKRWNPTDGSELAAFSFNAQLDRAWLLARGQIAAIVRKPVAGELEFFQVPAKRDEQPKLLATIPIVSLFDGFPTVHREFTIPQIALSPDCQRLALVAKSGSNELAINRIAIYDMSTFMPKLAVVAASPGDAPRVASTTPTNDPPAKTTPAVPKSEREFRLWKTADGAFSVEAQFVGKIGELVRLKRKDNDKVISVPLDRLSDGDQTFVRSLR